MTADDLRSIGSCFAKIQATNKSPLKSESTKLTNLRKMATQKMLQANMNKIWEQSSEIYGLKARLTFKSQQSKTVDDKFMAQSSLVDIF